MIVHCLFPPQQFNFQNRDLCAPAVRRMGSVLISRMEDILLWRNHMIEVTETAASKLSAYLTLNETKSAIRIMAMQSCGGPSLGLVLADEPTDSDEIKKLQELTLVIDKYLSESCGKVTIDFIENTSGCSCQGGGFSLTSERPLPATIDACGSSCSSGSCGC